MKKVMKKKFAYTAALLFALGAAAEVRQPGIVFADGDVRAEFDVTNGALTSLAGADGVNRVLAAPEAFALSLLDDAGDETILHSGDFVFRRSGGEFVFSRPDGFEVHLTHRPSSGAFRTRITVRGWPSGTRLNWIDAPRVDVAEDGILYWPMYDGCEVSDFTYYDGKNSWCVDEPVGFFKRCRADPPLYPGNVTMQFMAAYRGGKGLYFAAEDERHVQKGVRWSHVEKGRVRLSMQVFCGDNQKDRRWAGDFDLVLRPYAGGWREACGFYRDWVRKLPGFELPAKRPAWFRESPVVVAYPVRGEGKDNEPLDMGPNAYLPYVNALPEIKRHHDYFGTGILALLMHWEGTAPWAPPYVWPPYGGKEMLAEYRDALHRNGDYLGLYCSGTAWTQVSMIVPSYSRTRQYTVEGLDRWMMRGPKGEIDAQVCNHPRAQRIGYDMCLTETWSRETVKREIASMDGFGVDYCQFFDQNLGGGGHLCFSSRHRHPSVPGAWGTEAMKSLQEESQGRMVVGCEGGAATPFVRNLYFNDSRAFFPAAFGLGRPVPGLAYVFHEWSSNFSGNGIGMKTSPIFRLAYSFHNGDMLTLVLAKPGRLAYAWGVLWSDPMPEETQALVLKLTKGFNDLRRKYPQYLFNGRMVPPFVVYDVPEVSVRLGAHDFRYPEILASFWESADGSQLGFFTNWRNQERKLSLRYADGRTVEMKFMPYETREVQMTP